MSKITSEHLARAAFVYVRQSTPIRWSTILRASGANMAWWSAHGSSAGTTFSSSMTILVDPGREARPGFEKLLAAICEGRVGAVVSLEASRLARNGRDWHTLLEFCGLVGTLIVDEELSTIRVRPTTGCCWA